MLTTNFRIHVFLYNELNYTQKYSLILYDKRIVTRCKNAFHQVSIKVLISQPRSNFKCQSSKYIAKIAYHILKYLYYDSRKQEVTEGVT